MFLSCHLRGWGLTGCCHPGRRHRNRLLGCTLIPKTSATSCTLVLHTPVHYFTKMYTLAVHYCIFLWTHSSRCTQLGKPLKGNNLNWCLHFAKVCTGIRGTFKQLRWTRDNHKSFLKITWKKLFLFRLSCFKSFWSASFWWHRYNIVRDGIHKSHPIQMIFGTELF